MTFSRMLPVTFSAMLLLSASGLAQQPSAAAPTPGSPEDLVQQGEKLARQGKFDDALALYKQALEKSPDLYQAHLAAGTALDLKGNYTEAREHFAKAIDLAPEDSKDQPTRAMAISYAFEGNGPKAAEFELRIYNARMAKNDLVGAAEICNENARIYLESGNPDQAYKGYRRGYEMIRRKTDLSEADQNLWLFRWESAQARVAAHRGQTDEAHKHVDAAKIALEKANNPDQMKFFPYLTGYVAFYTGDYKNAIAELGKADQRDPLILAMLGEAYEKTGVPLQAKDYYLRVLEINSHNPTNAFARPLAKKKLGQ